MQCIQLQIRDEVDCNVLLMYKFKIQSLHILYSLSIILQILQNNHMTIFTYFLNNTTISSSLNVHHNNNYNVQVYLSPGITSYTLSSSSFSLVSGGGGIAGRGWLEAEGVSYIPSRVAADVGPVLVGVVTVGVTSIIS